MLGLVFPLLLAGAMPALAVTVYKHVDAEGNVSYSDQPPAAGAEVQTIEIPEQPPRDTTADAERLQQMRETTDRMREDRLARERAAAPDPAPLVIYPPPAPEAAQSGDVYIIPGYRPRYPYRPGHPDHPWPPGAPPPWPQAKGMTPNTSSHSPRGLNARLREAR